MVWLPLSGAAIQRTLITGKPASGYVLKLYADGTSTNIPMATDTTGATTANSIAFNSLGDLTVSGNPVIPHIDQDYKYAIYPTQAAADSNTGAIITIDNCVFDVSQHVVDTGNYTEINVEGDGNFGDDVVVTNTTFTKMLKEKIVELEIAAGVLTVDWTAGGYFIYTNTEEHEIVFSGYPPVLDGYGQTIMITVYDAGAFTTTFNVDDYAIELRTQDDDIAVSGKVKYICSVCEAGTVFVGIQNTIIDNTV